MFIAFHWMALWQVISHILYFVSVDETADNGDENGMVRGRWGERMQTEATREWTQLLNYLPKWQILSTE